MKLPFLVLDRVLRKFLSSSEEAADFPFLEEIVFDSFQFLHSDDIQHMAQDLPAQMLDCYALDYPPNFVLLSFS